MYVNITYIFASLITTHLAVRNIQQIGYLYANICVMLVNATPLDPGARTTEVHTPDNLPPTIRSCCVGCSVAGVDLLHCCKRNTRVLILYYSCKQNAWHTAKAISVPVTLHNQLKPSVYIRDDSSCRFQHTNLIACIICMQCFLLCFPWNYIIRTTETVWIVYGLFVILICHVFM